MAASRNERLDTAALSRRWTRAEAERIALVRLARRSGLSEADAEDCVQESILKVVPRADVDEARMGSLLATVVKRRAIDLHRRAEAASRASRRLQTVASCEAEGPDVALCDRAEAEWSASVVERLPAFQRQVLLARAEGRSWSEIARELSTSVKAVESAVSRARASVRLAIASTLGIGLTLARRWRQPATAVAAGTTAFALIAAVTVPFLRPPDGPATAGPGSGSRAVELANPASANTPDPPAGGTVSAQTAAVPVPRVSGVVAPPAPEARTTTIATFSTPVTPNGKVTQNDDKEDTLSRVQRCFIGGEFHPKIEPSDELGQKPRIDARCEGDPDPKR